MTKITRIMVKERGCHVNKKKSAKLAKSKNKNIKGLLEDTKIMTNIKIHTVSGQTATLI